MADTDIIWVASTLPTLPDGGDKVVLSETDPQHPNEDHQAWIAGPKPVQVARTAGVERVLREGTAREVDAPAPASASGGKRGQSSAADQAASSPPAGTTSGT